MTKLSAPCQITVVDFSQDNFSIQRLDNNSIDPFLRRPQPAWVKCRWINVNGLSWDVIQVLGRHKNLHKLAIEDIINTRNRTKAEWFPTHAFIVLTLQKLVHTDDSSDDSSDGDDDRSSIMSHSSWSAPRRFYRRLRRLFRPGKHTTPNISLETGEPKHEKGLDGPPPQAQSTGFPELSALGQIRTLQQYHTPANDPRTQFMERHSSLDSRNLAVACEQVSLFLTHDNCIISFFELSAPDVEDPIIRRLQTRDTIIRQSCDASMVGQAIVDAIIDLAIPVTACYSDVIGDLELDVLTRPNLNHTKKLYIVITEINKMLSFINPIITLINALRDHKTDLSDEGAIKKLQDPSQGVIITPMTFTYLGDVLDHCVLITESLNRLKDSADGMIDLIFNTISAYQNESMRQLTVATIIFLPLTFLTGYFGQNFQPFDDLNLGISYFWKIAVPVVFATICILLRESIFEFVKSGLQRRYIGGLRRSRLKRRAGKRD
ncbi:hypothetical protein B0T22DRAFT_561 [Podospora appendiculata]|uniref:Uncharacterized protein n=1 Tax=Podospora appendiculata TaxID=314037 RepID=A0AAE0XES3_9PEZI|nr:hypothetical protein B0T22DRAFT_561 [Podospora appendiculata]